MKTVLSGLGALLLLLTAPAPVFGQNSYTWNTTGSSGIWSATNDWNPVGPTNGTNSGPGATATNDIAYLINLSANTVVNYNSLTSGSLGELNMWQTTSTANTYLVLDQNLTLNGGTSGNAGSLYTTEGNASTTGLEQIDLQSSNLTIGTGETFTIGSTSNITLANTGGAPAVADITDLAVAGSGASAGNGGVIVNGTLLVASGGNNFLPEIAAPVTLGANGILDLSVASPSAEMRFYITGNFTTTNGSKIEATGSNASDASIYFLSPTVTIASNTSITGFGSATVNFVATTNSTYTFGSLFDGSNETTLTFSPSVANGTASNQQVITDIVSSSYTLTSNSITTSNAIDQIDLNIPKSTAYITLDFKLGSNLNLFSSGPGFNEFSYLNYAGNIDEVDLAGFAYNANGPAVSGNQYLSPSAQTSGVNSEISFINSGATAITSSNTILGSNGVGEFSYISTAANNFAIGSGVIFRADTAGSADNLGSTNVSGGALVATISPSSAFYYTGTSGTTNAVTTLTANRTIGDLIVGNGTTAATLQILNTQGTLSVGGGLTVSTNATFDLNAQNLTQRDGNGTTNAITGGLEGGGTILDSTNSTSTLTLNTSGGNGLFSGIIKNNAGTGGTVALVTTGTGTQTLTGTNTFTGGVTLDGGSLDLGGEGATGALSSSNALTLGGGALLYTKTGTNTQTFNGTTVAAGGSAVYTTNSTDVINLGAITRNAGGTVDFTPGSGAFGVVTSTANDAAGILGGYATVGGNTWAVSNGTNAITGLANSNYLLASTAGTTAGNYTGSNIDVDTNETLGGTITPNTLRFNNTSGAGAYTLDLAAGTNVITSGGILVTTNVGSNPETITGGNLTGSSGGDLVIIQNNTGGALTIDSTIVDNTSSTGLTLSGAGTLTLTASNTYTGATYANGGTLDLQSQYAVQDSVLTIAPAGTVVFDQSVSGNAFTVGALAGAGNLALQNNAGSPAAVALTLGNNNDGGTFSGNLSGSGSLIKIGSGTQVLSGANTYSGATSVTAGALDLLGSMAGSGITTTGTGVFSETNSGIISGTGAFTQRSTGTSILGGLNSYTGATTVAAGALNIQGNFGLGSGAGQTSGVTVSSGAALQLQGGITTAEAVGLTLNGAGVTASPNGALENVSGTNTYTGLIVLGSASTIGSDGGLLVLNNAGTITGSGFGLTLTGAGNGSLASILGTGAGTLTKTGSGTWTLSGANTFSGGLTIDDGIIAIATTAASGTAQPLGENSGTNAVVFAGANATTSDAVLDFTGTNTTTLAQKFTVSLGDYGVIENTGGSILDLTGAINKNGSVLTLSGGKIVVSGVISGTSNGSDLDIGSSTYGGAATVALAVANSYNGPTYINDGSYLLTTINNALPTPTNSALTLGAASDSGVTNTLDLAGTSETVASLNVGSTNSNVVNQVISSASVGSGTNLTTTNTASTTLGTLTVDYTNTGTNDTFSGKLGGSGSATNFGLVKSGAGTLILTGTNIYTGATTVTTGTLQIGNGTTGSIVSTTNTVNGAGATLAFDGSNTYTFAGNITDTTGTVAGVEASGTTNTLSGNISGGGGFAQTGAGTTILSGTNTYTGGTAIDAGVLQFASLGSLGATNSTITLSGLNPTTSNATLDYTGGTGILAQNLTVSNGDYGMVENGGIGVLDLTGNISKNGSVLTLSGGQFVVSGVISGSSNNSDLDLNNAQVALNNTNTYNGPTSIADNSYLLTTTNNALPTAPASDVTFGTNTDSGVTNTLDLAGTSETVGSLFVGSTNSNVINQVISSASTGSGTNLSISTLSSTNQGTLTVTTSTNDTFSGSLGGSGSATNFGLVMNGTGTLTLSGTNTYTGPTTVTTGTLQVTGSILSPITTINGGTLQGNGSVKGIVVNSGGNITPGAAGFTPQELLSSTTNNVLTATSLTLNGGASLTYNLYSSTVSPPLTQPLGGNVINLDGGLLSLGSLGTGTNALTLDFNGTGTVGFGTLANGNASVYDLITNFSSPTITAAQLNSDLSDGEIVLDDLTSYNMTGTNAIPYADFDIIGTAGDYTLQLQVTPEPSTWAMFALGLGLLIVCLRKRRRQG